MIGKATASGDFLKSQISVPQKLLGPFNPILDDQGIAGAIERLPQSPVESRDTHSKNSGHVLECYGIMKVRINELFQPGELALRQPRRIGRVLADAGRIFPEEMHGELNG